VIWITSFELLFYISFWNNLFFSKTLYIYRCASTIHNCSSALVRNKLVVRITILSTFAIMNWHKFCIPTLSDYLLLLTDNEGHYLVLINPST